MYKYNAFLDLIFRGDLLYLNTQEKEIKV